MMSKLVTVIVAVYNTEPYLEECVKSIVNQTYRNMEVLLIDDASPDNAPKICDEYAAKHEFIQVVHKENGGVSSVRNLGIEMAKGEYVCFIDSDDYLHKDYLKEMVAAIEKNNADVAVCGSYRQKESGDFKQMCCKENGLLDNTKAMSLMFYDNAFGAYPWNKLYRKSIIDKYDIKYDLSLRMSQDLVWVTTYMKECKKVEYVAKPLYYYRYNQNSVCRNIKNTGVFDRKKLITLQAHEMTKEIIKDCNDEINKAFQGRLVCTYMRLMVNMRYSDCYDKELVGRCKREIRKNLKAFLTRPAYGVFDRFSAILIAVSPRVFWFLFGIAYKVFKLSV